MYKWLKVLQEADDNDDDEDKKWNTQNIDKTMAKHNKSNNQQQLTKKQTQARKSSPTFSLASFSLTTGAELSLEPLELEDFYDKSPRQESKTDRQKDQQQESKTKGAKKKHRQ